MYIDLLLLLLLSLFLGARLWNSLGQNPPKQKTKKKGNLYIVPQSTVTIEKEGSVKAAKAAALYPGFDESSFLTGAEKAFNALHKALKEGDEPMLERLTHQDFLPAIRQTYAPYARTIDAICLLSATIQDKKVHDGWAILAVQIVSQQTQGEKIRTVEEVWTFTRSLSANGPNWLLVGIV